MAILKVSEFSDKYDLKRTNVYTYQKRGKLIIIDGYLDEDNQINRMFITGRQLSSKVKTTKQKTSKSRHEIHKIHELPREGDLEESKSYKDTEEKTKNVKHPKTDPIYDDMRVTADLRDKKLREEIRAAQIKNDKSLEKLIPRDETGMMVNAYLSKFIMNYMQQTDVLIRESLNEAQANNILIKKSCAKLVDIINNCQDIALKEIEIGFKNVSNASK